MFFKKNSYCKEWNIFTFKKNIVKKILFFVIINLIFSNLKSQNFNLEPGISIGTSYYLGDINHSKQFYSPSLALGFSLRHNYNEHYALRLNVIRATISGNDADFSNFYQQTRNFSFENTLYEFSLIGEFNFLSFTSYINKSGSPYIVAGLAFLASNSFSSYPVAFPIGVGYKYVPIKRMTLSFEWTFRATTSDELDLLVQEPNSKQLTKTYNSDWYSIAGVTITYNLQSDKKWCPAYKKR